VKHQRGGKPGEKAVRRTPYCYEYPRPAVTVDLVAFALFGHDLRVLLVRRKHAPFAGCWALPGGFLEMDEPVEAAARRELHEETGFEVPGPVELIGVFGAPGRDPRGRTISLVHAAAVRAGSANVSGGDDAAEAGWRDPWRLSGLAFDHDDIMAAALAWLERGVVDGGLALALLPTTFDVADVWALLEPLSKPPPAAAAWIARMRRAGRIVPAGGGRGRYRSRNP
jgi:8-oxo-dGTP diphosphatase